MKRIILTMLVAFLAMPLAASAQGEEAGLRQVDKKYVCMINNTIFGREQIAVELDGKTYYGCCPMCKEMLTNDPATRTATDPVSGASVDKASAIIGADESGAVYYFESVANLEAFSPDPEAAHGDATKGAGVLNAVDPETRMVNITHGPIPELRWPEMTMDLHVAESVDLSPFEAGDEVIFHVSLHGNGYHIVRMSESPAATD